GVSDFDLDLRSRAGFALPDRERGLGRALARLDQRLGREARARARSAQVVDAKHLALGVARLRARAERELRLGVAGQVAKLRAAEIARARDRQLDEAELTRAATDDQRAADEQDSLERGVGAHVADVVEPRRHRLEVLRAQKGADRLDRAAVEREPGQRRSALRARL